MMNRLPLLLIGGLVALRLICAQDALVLTEKWSEAPPQSDKEILVFYYFGASWCGPCNQDAMVKRISEVKEKLGKQYPNYLTKCVGVSLDTDFKTGVGFLRKYGAWDEVSLGGGVLNQAWLQCAPETWPCAVPHCCIFLDHNNYSSQFGHHTTGRLRVGDYLGLTELQAWESRGFPLWQLGATSGNSTNKSRFVGTWRSRSVDHPSEDRESDMVVSRSESGQYHVQIRSEREKVQLDLDEIQGTEPWCLHLHLRSPVQKQPDLFRCVLSLDGTSLWLTPDGWGRPGVVFTRTNRVER